MTVICTVDLPDEEEIDLTDTNGLDEIRYVQNAEVLRILFQKIGYVAKDVKDGSTELVVV